MPTILCGVAENRVLAGYVRKAPEVGDIREFGAAGRNEFGWTDDYNGANQEGFARLQMSIDRGRRASASNAYLRPVMKRKTLSVMTGATVRALSFQGDRVIGVQFSNRSGLHTAVSTREVILAGGVM